MSAPPTPDPDATNFGHTKPSPTPRIDDKNADKTKGVPIFPFNDFELSRRVFTLMPAVQSIEVTRTSSENGQDTALKPARPFLDAFLILMPRVVPSSNGSDTVSLEWDLAFWDSSREPVCTVWRVVGDQDTVKEESLSDVSQRSGLAIFHITAEEERDFALDAIRGYAEKKFRTGKVKSLDWASLALETVNKKLARQARSWQKLGKSAVTNDVAEIRNILSQELHQPALLKTASVEACLLQGFGLADQYFLELKLRWSLDADTPRSLHFCRPVPTSSDVVINPDPRITKIQSTRDSLQTQIDCCRVALVLVCGYRPIHKDQYFQQTVSMFDAGDVYCKLMLVDCQVWESADVFMSRSPGGETAIGSGSDVQFSGDTQGGIFVGYCRSGKYHEMFHDVTHTPVCSRTFDWAMDAIRTVVIKDLLLGPDRTSVLTPEWLDKFNRFLLDALSKEITVLCDDESKAQALWEHLNAKRGDLVDDHYLELRRQWTRRGDRAATHVSAQTTTPLSKHQIWHPPPPPRVRVTRP